MSDQDKADIRDTLDTFFQAFGNQDLATQVKLRKQYSTGELATWMSWIGDESAAGPQPMADVTIDEVTFGSFRDGVASVHVMGHAVYNDGTNYSLEGPALVQKTSGGWKVVDYTRDGRDQLKAVFTDVGGEQSRAGVTVKVIGVVLQEDYVDVFVSVRNATSNKISLTGGDRSLVTKQGKQLGGGQIGSADTDLASHASLTTDFYFGGKALPLSTRGFRLLVGMAIRPSFESIDYDFPVTLTS